MKRGAETNVDSENEPLMADIKNEKKEESFTTQLNSSNHTLNEEQNRNATENRLSFIKNSQNSINIDHQQLSSVKPTTETSKRNSIFEKKKPDNYLRMSANIFDPKEIEAGSQSHYSKISGVQARTRAKSINQDNFETNLKRLSCISKQSKQSFNMPPDFDKIEKSCEEHIQDNFSLHGSAINLNNRKGMMDS